MVHLTNIYHWCKLATSWEWGTCKNIGYLSPPHWPSVNMMQGKETTSVFSLIKLRLVAAFSWLTHDKQQLTWAGKINVIWYTECREWPCHENSQNDEVNIWQVASQSFSWLFVQYAHIVTFVKDSSCKSAASKCNMLYGKELQYAKPHICFSLT